MQSGSITCWRCWGRCTASTARSATAPRRRSASGWRRGAPAAAPAVASSTTRAERLTRQRSATLGDREQLAPAVSALPPPHPPRGVAAPGRVGPAGLGGGPPPPHLPPPAPALPPPHTPPPV